MEHLCANLCFICTTAPRGWSIITPQSRDVEEAEGCRGLARATHHVRAELGQAPSEVLGQAPLAAGCGPGTRIVHGSGSAPWQPRAWSHLQPSNSLGQSPPGGGDLDLSVFPVPSLWAPEAWEPI